MKLSLRQLSVVFGLACGVASAQSDAPTNTSPRALPNRYLLVFDTSAAMKSRAKAVQETAAALIVSGMRGQLRPGDSIGVWTFNEKLYTGRFPLQVWQPAQSTQIAARIVEFLRSQKYEKKAAFDPVVPALANVVSNSNRITVILFSDCSTPVRGTPFDAELNAIYAENKRAAKRTTAPFVTVLHAQNGMYLRAAGTLATRPINLPPFPRAPELTGDAVTWQAASPASTSPHPKQAQPPQRIKRAAQTTLDVSSSRQTSVQPAKPAQKQAVTGRSTNSTTAAQPEQSASGLFRSTNAPQAKPSGPTLPDAERSPTGLTPAAPTIGIAPTNNQQQAPARGLPSNAAPARPQKPAQAQPATGPRTQSIGPGRVALSVGCAAFASAVKGKPASPFARI